MRQVGGGFDAQIAPSCPWLFIAARSCQPPSGPGRGGARGIAWGAAPTGNASGLRCGPSPEEEVESDQADQRPRLPGLDRWFDAFRGSAVSVAFPLVVIVTFGIYRWLDRSRAGREMRWVGLGAQACAAQGINVARRRIQAMFLSGALAGLAVTGTVLGYKGYYELGLGAGAGFSGIAVAMVGRSNPVALVLSALAFGTLAQAGLAINAQVPKEAMGVLEAVVILLVAAATAQSSGKTKRSKRPIDNREAEAEA